MVTKWIDLKSNPTEIGFVYRGDYATDEILSFGRYLPGLGARVHYLNYYTRQRVHV